MSPRDTILVGLGIVGVVATVGVVGLVIDSQRWHAYENEYFTEERVYAAEVVEATPNAAAVPGDGCTLRVRVAARCQRGCGYWRPGFELRCGDAVVLPWIANADYDCWLKSVERDALVISGDGLAIDTGAGQLVFEHRLSSPALRIALKLDPVPRERRPAPCKLSSFWDFVVDGDQTSCYEAFIERAGEPEEP